MATMRTADSWQQARGRYERPPLPGRDPRGDSGGRGAEYRRPTVPPTGRRMPGQPARGDEREMHRDAADSRRRPAAAGSRYDRPAERGRSGPRLDAEEMAARPARRPAAARESGRLRGVVAIAAVFLVTLAGAAVDSFVGVGLGMITLVALVGATAVGTLMVRRRDLVSVVVAPPLIFVAVTLVNIALAPSASLSLPTMATLLIRGFPTMALATGTALVLAIVRAAARR